MILIGAVDSNCQTNLYAVRASAYQGYSVLDNEGQIKFELPRYAEPIFDGIIRSGSYPDVLSIPVVNGNLPIRFLENFYIIDTLGTVTRKLHEETEWVHPFNSNKSRVSLFREGNPRLFRDMYITSNGENPFGNKIFMDGKDYIAGKAVVQDFEDKDWKIIDSTGVQILNISHKFKKLISTVNNIQKDIWQVSFQDNTSAYISSSGKTNTEIETFPSYNAVSFNLNRNLKQRLSSYELRNYSPNERNNYILYDTIKGSFKTKPVIYSDDYETKYLKDKTSGDTLTPYRIIGNSIVAMSDKHYHIYNKSDLEYITTTEIRPFLVTENLIVSNERIDDYRKENLVLSLDNKIIFDPNSNYKIRVNTDSTSIENIEIKELVLINPTKTELQNLSLFENIEVITIVNLSYDELPWYEFNSLNKLEVLNLIRCQLITAEELNRESSQIEFLNIKGGKLLKHFRPDEDKWTALQMYSKGHLRYTTKNKRKLTVSNKL